jgi:hypothetical protein
MVSEQAQETPVDEADHEEVLHCWSRELARRIGRSRVGSKSASMDEAISCQDEVSNLTLGWPKARISTSRTESRAEARMPRAVQSKKAQQSVVPRCHGCGTGGARMLSLDHFGHNRELYARISRKSSSLRASTYAP